MQAAGHSPEERAVVEEGGRSNSSAFNTPVRLMAAPEAGVVARLPVESETDRTAGAV